MSSAIADTSIQPVGVKKETWSGRTFDNELKRINHEQDIVAFFFQANESADPFFRGKRKTAPIRGGDGGLLWRGGQGILWRAVVVTWKHLGGAFPPPPDKKEGRGYLVQGRVLFKEGKGREDLFGTANHLWVEGDVRCFRNAGLCRKQ